MLSPVAVRMSSLKKKTLLMDGCMKEVLITHIGPLKLVVRFY